MRKGRGVDENGICLILFLHNGTENLQQLLQCLQEILLHDTILPIWYDLLSRCYTKMDV